MEREQTRRLLRLWAILILVLLLAGCMPVPPPLPPATATNQSAPTSSPAPTAPPASPTAAPTAPPTVSPPAIATSVPGAAGMPWWNDTVFYQIFVRSFADSTTGPLANDGIGDLQGIIEKLDYLQGLGVRGVWLTPIMESPSYHGYDVSDYRIVNKLYGTNEDFKRLMAEAHKREIRIIIDLVLNHTSNQHPWFQDASKPGGKYRDWYIWADKDGGYRGPWGQQVWHRLGDQWYFGMFWEGMPDLNYRNPQVTEEMHEVARFWLREMGADGFRLDAVRYLLEDGAKQTSIPETLDWLRRFQKVYKEAGADTLAVGEIWTSTAEVGQYVPAAVDLAFEFDLAQGILNSISRLTADAFATALTQSLATFPPGQFATFLTNHDQERAMSQLAGQPDRARLAALILMTAPGVPFVYYGEEIGMTGVKPDEKLRTPMQWTPGPNAGFSAGTPWQSVNPGYETLNVQTERADPASLLNWYRKLIALRNAHPALRIGSFEPLDTNKLGVYAFLRRHGDETFLGIFNFDSGPATGYMLKLAGGKLPGPLTATDLLAGAPVAPPALDAAGGFDGYQPFPQLAPRTGYLIQLRPGR
jgi:glycosidase